VRISFLGTPEAAVPTLQLLAAHHEIVRVVTRPDRRAPRGKGLQPSPVGAAAEALDLPLVKPIDRTDLRGIEFGDAELAVVVAFGMIIPKDVLALPKHGFMNLHFSLLPRWRGAAPVERAILAGDAEHGICIMAMDAGLDTGNIYQRVVVPIEGLSAGDATTKFAEIGSKVVADVVKALDLGIAETVPQEGESTYAAKVETADARLDANMGPAEFLRAVRAFEPRPGAFLMSQDGRFKVLQARSSDVSTDVGKMEAVKQGVVLGLLGGSVLLERVQAPARRQMSAADWARGLQEPLEDIQWL
jgi:methionyl-tRNA formyltransferase